jgi:hypothetical protein
MHPILPNERGKGLSRAALLEGTILDLAICVSLALTTAPAQAKARHDTMYFVLVPKGGPD